MYLPVIFNQSTYLVLLNNQFTEGAIGIQHTLYSVKINEVYNHIASSFSPRHIPRVSRLARIADYEMPGAIEI